VVGDEALQRAGQDVSHRPVGQGDDQVNDEAGDAGEVGADVSDLHVDRARADGDARTAVAGRGNVEGDGHLDEVDEHAAGGIEADPGGAAVRAQGQTRVIEEDAGAESTVDQGECARVGPRQSDAAVHVVDLRSQHARTADEGDTDLLVAGVRLEGTGGVEG